MTEIYSQDDMDEIMTLLGLEGSKNEVKEALDSKDNLIERIFFLIGKKK
jgi:hypothetical protein